MSGTGAGLSARQQRLKKREELARLNKTQLRERAKQIAAEKAATAAKLEPTAIAPSTGSPADVVELKPADGVNIVHERADTGQTYALRMDPLEKLRRSGKITNRQSNAGVIYLGVVQAHYGAASFLAKMEREADLPRSLADPIRLYVKGRRKYVSTQRPRIIPRGRQACDGWTHDRLDALSLFTRMCAVVKTMGAEEREALRCLVIDPFSPNRPTMSMAATTKRMFGSSGTSAYDRLTEYLCAALDALAEEFSLPERLAA